MKACQMDAEYVLDTTIQFHGLAVSLQLAVPTFTIFHLRELYSFSAFDSTWPGHMHVKLSKQAIRDLGWLACHSDFFEPAGRVSRLHTCIRVCWVGCSFE